MTDEIIGMADMMAIYEVTDLFGIDRESISVPLDKEGNGSVRKEQDGGLEIVAPASISTAEWLPTLKSELQGLGFELQDEEDDSW